MRRIRHLENLLHLPGDLRQRDIGNRRRFVAGFRRLAGIDTLIDGYRQLPPGLEPESFVAALLRQLDISAVFSEQDLQRVPAHGPAIVVANHPSGLSDGLLMAQLLLRRRSNVKFLANHLLSAVPELKPLFINVDILGGTGSVSANTVALRTAIRWVRDGGLLVVFPAGIVASRPWPWLQTREAAWLPGVARVIEATGAPVIPAFIHSRNSELFHILGRVHPALRTLMLPRELLGKRGNAIRISLGRPIAAEKLSGLKTAVAVRYLRLKTLALGKQAGTATPAPRPANAPCHPETAPDNASVSCIFHWEIHNLPAAQCLGRSNHLSVYYAAARQIPWLLREIGRQRELAFRAAGEGTGAEIDLDRHDDIYLHLFVWDENLQRLVGAYRLGLSDEILRHHGIDGLYTHSLFKYSEKFLDRIQPAMELGRSFIRAEYQRSYAPLLLLWKGIATFVSRHPRYRYLFGPVSISNDYTPLSRQLLVDFLRHHHYDSGLARHVKPRKPFRRLPRTPWSKDDFSSIRSIDNLSDILAQLEVDGKGVPVLVRQYLKLGGVILGFNIDPAFHQALDGLILVDLLQTDPQTLQRYMGAGGLAAFLAHYDCKARAG